MNPRSENETSSATQIEDQILELAKSKENGFTNKDIASAIPHVPPSEWTAVINRFLKTGSLELFKDKNFELLYKYKEVTKQSVALKGLDNEEKVVFKIIQDAGNKGIWIRDIRFKSNLNMTQLNKVLKSLETRKYIKAVKSVIASKKKVYMLYDLEPDSSVTGGAWYQDHDFESEFVDVLGQQCHRYLMQKADDAEKAGGGPTLIRTCSYATAEDVHKFIADLGISKVQLSVADMESILYTVVLDNKAERTVNHKGAYLYRAVKSFFNTPGIVKSVCGICPIANRCADTGHINPNVCQYLTEWLND